MPPDVEVEPRTPDVGAQQALRQHVITVGVFVLAVVVYLNTLGNGFTLDDNTAVVANGVIRGPLSLRAIFTHDYWGAARATVGGGLYRPLPSLTYALDWHLAAGHPWVFHLTSALVHGLASLLFYRLMCARVSDRRAGVMAAVLFAVHPLHTEAVASIVGRADVMAFVFSVVAWWLHPRTSLRAGVGAAVALVCALLCKESAVLLGPLLVLHDLLERPPWRRALGRYALYAVAFAGYLGARVYLTGTVQGFQINPGVNALAAAPFVTRELSALRLFARCIKLLIAPTDLMPVYGASVVHPSATIDVSVVFGASAVLALLVLAVRARRTMPFVTECVGWFLLPALFVCNAFKTYSAAFGERLLYFPSAGALLLAGEGLAWLFRRGRTRMAYGLALTFVVLFIPLTLVRNADWQSDVTLFTAAVRTQPGCSGCHYVLGIQALEAGHVATAVRECGAAARLMPSWGSAWGCDAASLEATGRSTEADAAYTTMMALPDANVEWQLRYLTFMVAQHREADARALLRTLDAMPLTPPRRRAVDVRARALGLRGLTP